MIKTLKNINYWLAEKYKKIFLFQPFIQPIFLHKIYKDKKDVSSLHGTTDEGITISDLDCFIKYFVIRNYTFIDEDDLSAGNLDSRKCYLYLNFDDGYYNNIYALEILEKYNVKATFFIATEYIEKQTAFWWDVIYRERSFQNRPSLTIYQEIEKLKSFSCTEIEEFMKKEFGANCLSPVSDMDRPMTPEELKRLSSHSSVRIGNHTSNHLNMLIHSDEVIKKCIRDAETFLQNLVGKPIQSIAYPYGFYNQKVTDIVKNLHYKIGVTAIPGTIFLNKLHAYNLLEISRYHLSGLFNIEIQCREIDVGFSMLSGIKKIFNIK